MRWQRSSNLSIGAHIPPFGADRELIRVVCAYLGNIKARISNSWDYTMNGGPSERIADLSASR